MSAREIVKLAAREASAPALRAALSDDSRGVWEREAAHLWGLPSVQAAISSGAVSSEDAKAQVATLLALTCAEALLRVAAQDSRCKVKGASAKQRELLRRLDSSGFTHLRADELAPAKRLATRVDELDVIDRTLVRKQR